MMRTVPNGLQNPNRIRKSTLALAASMALATTALPAQEATSISATAGQEQAAQRIHLDMVVFKVMLDEANPTGMPVTTAELIEATRRGGIPALHERMAQEGEVGVVMRADTFTRVGDSVVIDAGGEQPFVITSQAADGTTSTTRQALSTGVSLDYRVDQASPTQLEIACSLDVSEAFVKPVEGQDMLGRIVFEVNSTFLLDLPTDVHIGRFIRIVDETPIEFIVVFHLID